MNRFIYAFVGILAVLWTVGMGFAVYFTEGREGLFNYIFMIGFITGFITLFFWLLCKI